MLTHPCSHIGRDHKVFPGKLGLPHWDAQSSCMHIFCSWIEQRVAIYGRNTLKEYCNIFLPSGYCTYFERNVLNLFLLKYINILITQTVIVFNNADLYCELQILCITCPQNVTGTKHWSETDFKYHWIYLVQQWIFSIFMEWIWTRQIRTPVLRIPPAVTSQAKMKNWLHECQKWVSHMIGQYAHI